MFWHSTTDNYSTTLLFTGGVCSLTSVVAVAAAAVYVLLWTKLS